MRSLNKIIFALFISVGIFSCAKKNIGFFHNNYQRYEAKNQKAPQTAAENIQASSSDNKHERSSGFNQIQSDHSNTQQYISENNFKNNTSETRSQNPKLTKEEKKAIKKEIRQLIKNNKNNESDVSVLLLVILAILLPPLAVALVDGISGPFWLSILLTILFYVPGLIYALWRIFRQ